MKKKLSILITSLTGGGAERVVSILLSELRDSYEIRLVLMNDCVVYDIPEDTHIIYLENKSQNENAILKILKLPILGWKYYKICKNNNIDISLSFMYRPNFINILSRIFGGNYLVAISERNTPSEVYSGNLMSSIVGRLLIKNLYPKSDVIIPNSNGIKKDLVDNFNIDVNDIVPIENPFDINRIQLLSNDEVYIDKSDDFIFLMVARLEEHKRHSLVIEAFSKLKNNKSQLWILGQGPFESKLKRKIEEFNLEGKVKLLGFDNNPYKYMSKADCFVLASTREGFPNVIVEALSCDLPVISTDCHSGPREILSPKTNVRKKLSNEIEVGDYGILVPVDNKCELCRAMKLIIDDFKLRDFLRKKSRYRALDFSKEEILKKFQHIL